jgi:hypothetical protein
MPKILSWKKEFVTCNYEINEVCQRPQLYLKNSNLSVTYLVATGKVG